MSQLDRKLSRHDQLSFEELVKVSGEDVRMRRDIARGVYFFNQGYFTNNEVPFIKINLLSENFIKITSAIIRIQRVWKGFKVRRSLKQELTSEYTRQRAACRIQRWFRNLKFSHRKNFMTEQVRFLKSFTSNCFYMRIKDYLQLMKNEKSSYIKFLEQNIVPYFNHDTSSLTVFWDRNADNPTVRQNYSLRKKLFTSHFHERVFDGKYEMLLPNNERQNEEVPLNYLLHFETLASTVQKKGEKFVEIECKSKYECRFRVLSLITLNYQVNKRTEAFQFFNKECFQSHELKGKKPIFNSNSIFIRLKESVFEMEPSDRMENFEYTVKSKFYLTSESTKKPVRFEESLCITILQNK